MDNVPLLEKSRPRDVMQLGVQDRILVLRTPLPNTVGDGYARVKLDGLRDFALVRVQGVADAAGHTPTIPANFQFTLNDYSQPRQITTLSITSEQTYLTIAKSIQFPDGYSNVQFVERTGSPGYGQVGAVQLSVSESGLASDSPLSFSIEATDFFSLLRTCPQECQEFLRPLFRELGQEEALAPDALVAWQVFRERWKPDPVAEHQVTALLPALEKGNFQAREEATEALQKLGRTGAEVMVHLDRRTLTCEQSTRIDRALGSYAQLSTRETLRLGNDAQFLLDCLYCNDRPLRQAALDRLRELTDPQMRFDLDGDIDHRATQIAAIRRQLAPLETALPEMVLSSSQ
jgi:hypothetical protein